MTMLKDLAFEQFMHPWMFILLVPVALLFVAECVKRAPGALYISTGETLARIRGRGRNLLQLGPPVLRALGLSLLVVALARPMTELRPQVQRVDVVDIMLCVDVSGSMRVVDFVAEGRPRDRLTVTKAAVQDFIRNRKLGEEDRFGIDRIGLVLYAAYAWTQTPLTLDYNILERDLALAHIDEADRAKRGTAIGSAIGLAVAKLHKSEAESKVIILLTDGINNTGELDPITAARIAADYGIRIYTIGAGSSDEVLVPRQTLWGEHMMPARMPIDEEVLRQIAEITGGKYYRATDFESLRQAYDEISSLEATEIEVSDYYEHDEAFESWAVLGGLALAGSILGRRWRFDPIP